MKQGAALTVVPVSYCSWIYGLYNRHSRVISAELLYLERIRIYHVGFNISTWNILADRLQHPAPRIEYLDINHINYRATDSFIFPSNLFAGAAPRLKRLDMTQCLIDFQAPTIFNDTFGRIH
jgi:hypothetical protein